MNSPSAAAQAGVTYRRLHHWAQRGWLQAAGERGSGHGLWWPAGEVEIARRMGRLTAAGIPPARAAQFARRQWPEGEIAPGIKVVATG